MEDNGDSRLPSALSNTQREVISPRAGGCPQSSVCHFSGGGGGVVSVD